jgi:tetratricopeptide (TPR) repeat protein
MKRRIILSVIAAAVMAVLSVPAAWGQGTTVKGYVHDTKGEPVAGAVLQFTNKDNGRKYEVKTTAKGEYFMLGVASGRYDILILKDGNQLFKQIGVPVSFSTPENVINIDLKKEQEAQQAQISPEEKKRQEEQQKQVNKVKTLNDKLAQAKAAQDAGNPQQAVAILVEATQVDPSQPVIWAMLAETERSMALKLTDPSEKKAAYSKAVEDYKKALELKPNASYLNNMGDAAARSGDMQSSVQAYEEAAKLDPGNAAQYYYNEGAVLTNVGKVDEAIQIFDKAIQADPTKADAYYWKGVNLLGKATTKGDKMVAPPGTAEAFNKYLELQPTGQFAEPAKQMLASIGATVETSFGKGKTGTKTKK